MTKKEAMYILQNNGFPDYFAKNIWDKTKVFLHQNGTTTKELISIYFDYSISKIRLILKHDINVELPTF